MKHLVSDTSDPIEIRTVKEEICSGHIIVLPENIELQHQAGCNSGIVLTGD